MQLKRTVPWALAFAILLALAFGAGAYTGRRYGGSLRGGVRDAIAGQTEQAYFYWSRESDSYRQKGQELYNAHCSTCHGADGKDGRAPDLTGPRTKNADALGLARVVREGIPGTEMPPFQRLLTHRESFQIVAHLLEPKGEEAATNSAAGDPAAGASLIREKGNCLQCHTVGEEGIPVGPDLTNIGRSRSASYLRRKLQRPQETVPNVYRPIEVIKQEGVTIRGFRQNEDTFSIQVRGLDGQTHSFWKRDLQGVREIEKESFMPSYEGVFSEAELDHVVAFLASLGAP